MVNIQHSPKTIGLKPSPIFRGKNKIRFRHCKVVLKDILKCTVRLERLSSAQIARALRGESISIRSKPVIRQQQTQPVYEHEDHCYSKASMVPEHSRINDVLTSITSKYSSFESSSDSESNISDDDDNDAPIDGYCVVKGKVVAYPVTLDLDTDVEEAYNSVVWNGEDTQTEQDSGFNNDEYSEDFKQTNGMDLEHSPDSSSNCDDSDDDMRFLNNIAEQLDQTEDVESANCDANGEAWPSNRIFGEICLKYLRDACYGTYCDFPHELPETQIVEGRLRSASRREIEEVQNEILLQHEVLMEKFFALFCKFYGREWQTHRESLRRLISVVSTRPAAPSYMKEILGGFLISGMEYSTCIDQLLLELDDSLNSEERFEIVWELMIDPQNDRLNDQIDEFKHLLLSDALVAASAINRILEHQINGDLASLRDATNNIVKGTSVATFRKLDPALLKQYIQMLRSLNSTHGKFIQNKAKQFGVILDC
ncbi:uncharacterized protein LOC129575081 [Sitodiplosis mosellana]|uniref:uncharacterized protein LOC129575081 n=1 Tax=Sitodiplosis mosellana TaxID=263140 RepID=UPI00244398FF|nr:uncharacterized protein LOC129575081 [Sitodiplosis mosellana]